MATTARQWFYGADAERRRLDTQLATLDLLITQSEAMAAKADVIKAQMLAQIAALVTPVKP